MGNPCSKNECLYYLCCHCCCPDAASHRRSGSSTNTLLTNVEHQAHTVPPSGRNEVFQLTDLNEIIIVPPSGSSQITHGTSSSRNIPTSDPFDPYVRSYKQSQFTPNVRTEPYDRQRKVYISSVQETEIASRDYYTLGIFRNDDLSIDEDAEEIFTPKSLDDHNCNEQRNTEPILKGIEIIKSENREIVNGTEHVVDIFDELEPKISVYGADSDDEVHEYIKTEGHADMSGELYEIKMATLLYLLGLTNTKEFNLAANFQLAGAFDDIVFSCELLDSRKYVYFIQLKHRKNQIKPPSMFQRKDGFSLPKYWHSYNEIKTASANIEFLGKLEDFNYIIYTNANVSYMKSECQVQNHTIIKTNGKLYNFANDYNDLQEYKRMLDDLNSISCNDMDNVVSVTREFETRITNKELLYKIKLLKNKPTLNKIELMREELNSLGDLNDYGEFLKKVLLFAEQANETNLDTKIKQEIECVLFTSGDDTEAVFSYILQEMTNWWKNSCYFLTKSAPIWKNVILNCVAALNISPFCKTILFKKEDLEIFRKSIPQDQSTIILECSREGSHLVDVKLQQTFKHYQLLFVSQRKFLQKQHHIISLIKSAWVKLIILDLCVNDDPSHSEFSLMSELLSELISFVYRIKNKQLILILPTRSLTANYLLGRFGTNIGRLQIKCNITELDDESQNQIMDQVIDFQGKQIRFVDLIGNDEKLRKQITDDIITLLLSRKKQVKIGKRIDDEIPYYVHRELKTNRSIRWRILFEKEEDQLYIVSCLTRDETDRLKTKLQNNVILGGREQFHLQCVSNKNVHWLQTDGDVLRWMESQGNISPIIRNQVSRSRSTHLRHINSMKDVSDRIVLLIAEPGMGKSTFVTHLALQTKQIDPTCWVVHLNFNDHTVLLDAVDVSVWNKEKSVEFLLSAMDLASNYERVMFKHSILFSGNVVILLDGFDEISPTHADKAIILLKNLKLTATQKLWVTSRPIMEQRLQQELCVPPHFLQALDEESQRAMLHKFWEPKRKDNNLLNEFIWKLLYHANESLGHKDFTSIPLHIVMLATAFENTLDKCNQTDVIDIPDKFDLFELYDKFIIEKLNIYYCDKMQADPTKASVQDAWNVLWQSFMENHMRAALQTLLTTDHIESLHDRTILDINATFLEKIQNGKEKTGIIFKVTDGKPQFIHRTFAEFFMAQWFSMYFKYNKVLMETVLFASNYGLMRNMFDRILARKKKLHLAILNEDVHGVKQLCNTEDVNERDFGGRTPLHLIASQVQSSEMFEMATCLLKAGASQSIVDGVLEWTPLHYAWKVQSWKIAGELLKQHLPEEKIPSLVHKFQGNLNEALYVAAENDYVQLLEVLSRNCKNINQCIEAFMQQTIAHIAAMAGSLQIMRWLQHNGCVFKQVDGQGKTPLHLAAEKNQLTIVQFLVEECNANIGTMNFAGETALDVARSEGAVYTTKYLQEIEI